ncbi:MATE efflux family protein [Tepidanaerobacter acetatoxydans Re1]|uniref:Probable multidrug resistance protein NorM n=1 Tax=Tepidanaerobacter acetatoxydans (strain DSM 21804 / JCM 16047 / Re1) TaxID=1209989 RepID=F4LU21_TEPAE|nr:MATE family efflux transporter [Tepidanaerobacter acetatoxydans]AEE90547.1 MATE efflux family protein [Tepidanaerobacter acetatoxydans Re1]CCP25060.1 MATE efflux family protein [Tepidanaerobacter acetatoxydans Re1]
MKYDDDNKSIANANMETKIIIDEDEEKDLRKRVIQLAMPSLVELLLGTLFGMVDMVMVGRVNKESLAAVGITNQPTMLALAVFQALNVGSTALVARFMGTDDNESASSVVKQTLILTVILGTIVSILGYIFAGNVINFMGAKPDVFPLAVQYLKIISLGGIFISTSMGIAAALRGAGDTVTPMRYNLISNLINVGLNYILIYGKLGFPAMGVAGAAIATTVSRFVAMIMAVLAIYHPDSLLSLSKRKGIFLDYDIIKRILKIGIPSGVEQFVLRLGQVEFARTVAGLGTTVFAAHQVALNVFGLSFSPSQAFGMAATTLVGQSLGAGRPDMAEKYGLETRRMGMYVAVAIASTFFFFGRQIASIYTNDPQVILLAMGCLKIIAIMQPMQSTQFILAGALRGAGDTRGPLFATVIGIWGIRVMLAKVFIKMGFGLTGAWAAQACDQVFRSIFIYLRYNSGRWKRLRV